MMRKGTVTITLTLKQAELLRSICDYDVSIPHVLHEQGMSTQGVRALLRAIRQQVDAA